MRNDRMFLPRLLAVAEAAWTPVSKKSYGMFLKKLPYYLDFLNESGIYYFNLFDPSSTPEPFAPDKEDALKNG